MRLLSLAVLVSTFTALSSQARDKVGFSYSFAKDYRQAQLTGALDLPENKDLNIDVLVSRTLTSVSSSSRSIMLAVGLNYSSSDENSYRLGVNYWSDLTNKIRYTGLAGEWTRTYFHEKNKKTEDEDKFENFAVSLTSDLNFYTADLSTDSSGTPTPRGRTAPADPKTKAVRTAQFHPALEFEKSFADEKVKPFVGYGIYLYSVSPESIENSVETASQRYASVDTSGVTNMTGGFLKQNYDVGTRFEIGDSTHPSITYSRSQNQIDKTWASSLNLSIRQYIGSHFKLKPGYTLTIQSGTRINTITLGLDYLF